MKLLQANPVALGKESKPDPAAGPADRRGTKKEAATRTVWSHTSTYTTHIGALRQWRAVQELDFFSPRTTVTTSTSRWRPSSAVNHPLQPHDHWPNLKQELQTRVRTKKTHPRQYHSETIGQYRFITRNAKQAETPSTGLFSL